MTEFDRYLDYFPTSRDERLKLQNLGLRYYLGIAFSILLVYFFNNSSFYDNYLFFVSTAINNFLNYFNNVFAIILSYMGIEYQLAIPEHFDSATIFLVIIDMGLIFPHLLDIIYNRKHYLTTWKSICVFFIYSICLYYVIYSLPENDLSAEIYGACLTGLILALYNYNRGMEYGFGISNVKRFLKILFWSCVWIVNGWWRAFKAWLNLN